MKTYEKNITDRKVLVKRIEELTGQKSKYSFAPHMAYLFEGCAVEKDGTLTVEDGFDQGIINTLIAEGLILGTVDDPATEEAEEPAEEPAEATETAEEAVDTEEQVITEEADEPQDETVEGAAEVTEADETEATESDTPDETEETTDDGGLTISLPMTGHTPDSLRRLLNMVYSRGKLLSKATGGTFGVDKELLDTLDEAGLVINREDYISMVNEHGGLTGITISEDKISFTGFPFTYDAEKTKALQQLTVMMNKHALNQKRILAKTVDEANEKYIFRIWLVRLGMDGSEFKDARRILLENLSGHTAFRTKADEEKWKARQQEKRDALKAAKAAAKEATE